MWETYDASRITLGGIFMKWFSLKGVREEVRKIQWPKRKEMATYTASVLGFVVFFAVYFMFSEIIISQILRMLKVF